MNAERQPTFAGKLLEWSLTPSDGFKLFRVQPEPITALGLTCTCTAPDRAERLSPWANAV